MGGRRRLALGFRSWLPDHRSSDGKVYRRALQAGLELLGQVPNGSDLLRFEVEAYAKAVLLHTQATEHWADLLYRRRSGKGRRPSERRVERAARRVGLASISVKEATARLEELARRHGHGAGPTLDQIRQRYRVPS